MAELMMAEAKARKGGRKYLDVLGQCRLEHP